MCKKSCWEIAMLTRRLSGLPLCGVTDTDLGFENRTINVDHQWLFGAEVGYCVETPKTKSGIRQIPMSASVCEALQRVMKTRKGEEKIVIIGYSNSVFLNRDGKPEVANSYESMFRGACEQE